MKTSKQRFLETEHAKTFMELTNHPSFVSAMDYAMLQFLAEQPAATGFNDAAAISLKIEGARRFVQTLITLPIPVQPRPTRTTPDNLES